MTPIGTPPKPDDFPARIGYPAPTKGPADAVVLIDWDRLADLVSGAGPASRDRTLVQADGAIRFVTLPVGGTSLDVDVYALDSAEHAQRRLVSLASMTMMRTNPYVSGPPIGDLSCQLPPSGERDRLLWTRANLCISIRADQCDPALLGQVAARLDDRMKKGLVDPAGAANSSPTIIDMAASPAVGKVGRPVTVTWRTRPTTAVESAGTIVDAEGLGVTITDASPSSLTFTSDRPGDVAVEIGAVFPQWLVPQRTRLVVAINN